MQYRQLGESDVKVSAVTMGCWAIGGRWWGGTDDAKAVAAIHKAIDVGMTSFDSAPAYGFGHSESVIGQAIKGRRDKVQLLTKYGLSWETQKGEYFFTAPDDDGVDRQVYRYAGKESVIRECEQSLQRFGTDYIDVYQCHWRDVTTPLEETMEAMDTLIKAGKIRAAGVSNFTVEEMEACRKVVPLASDQPPYSMVKRDIEADILPYCRENNIGVVVYSPMQLGLLTGKLTMDREFPPNDMRADSAYFSPENRRRVIAFCDKLRPIAEAHNATVAQLVINWTIHRPGITAALVGARNPAQAEENAAAADFRLTEDQATQVEGLVKELKLEL